MHLPNPTLWEGAEKWRLDAALTEAVFGAGRRDSMRTV